MSRRPPPVPRDGPHKGRGWCRFCGEEIKPGQRKRPSRCEWHLECAEIWNIATSSDAMRRAVYRRDRGVCAECGIEATGRYGYDDEGRWRQLVPPWEADHIVPLWRAPREWSYWGLENLQTLCAACHKSKSAGEASLRAGRRRRTLSERAQGSRTAKPSTAQLSMELVS